jgi:O-methyltransferase
VTAKSLLAKAGLTVTRTGALYDAVDSDFWEIYRRCSPYTGSSIERMYALFKSIEYVVKGAIDGAIVECGVERGGSMMAAAHSLRHFGDETRHLYLYDTFAGMDRPTDRDVDYRGSQPLQRWQKDQRTDYNEWLYVPLERVQANMSSTGYPEEKLHFIKGRVEDTIPGIVPDRIAILRLDTDWYESTYHEMAHMFPLLAERGVLLIDDYGHWRGAREAVNQYLQESGSAILLNRLDQTGVIALKT